MDIQESKLERRKRLSRLNYARRVKEDPNYMKMKMKSVKKYHKTPKGKYQLYIYNAKVRHLEITLTQSEFINIINKPCYYCNSTENIGIDRKNNSIGYILENCNPSCSVCNYMKRTSTIKDFINKCREITALHK